MLKGNHRYNGTSTFINGDSDSDFSSKNGLKTLFNFPNFTSIDKQINTPISFDLDHVKESLSEFISIQNPSPLLPETKEEIVDKVEPENTHSIIGVSNNKEQNIVKSQSSSNRKRNNRNSYHESLERIGGVNICYNQYQKHWFSSSIELLKLEDKSREERLEITRFELQRRLQQIDRSNLGKCNYETADTSDNLDLTLSSIPTIQQSPQNLIINYRNLIAIRNCDIEMCKCQALPCSRYCELHIMQDPDQNLFTYCKAKFADSRQCTVPVCDILHAFPLCKEHARKRDNHRFSHDAKPKALRKKVKPSAMIRPQKRSKKKKRLISPPDIMNCKVDDLPIEITHNLTPDMVEQVLGLQEPDSLQLASVQQALVTQASKLLDESEINTVLSTIHGDEFSDFFTVNRNGDYEPTHEETEELERALAAVDNDVKSLEKLSQSQGLLDTFLDEATLVESLVHIPDIFHNGYSQCGDHIISQTSRLLSIEPHSHS